MFAAMTGQPRGASESALLALGQRPTSTGSTASTASTVSEPAIHLSSIDVAGFARQELREPDLTATHREELINKARFVIRDPTAGFSRPDPNLRKFMWIHTPFTNPVWVRVSEKYPSANTPACLYPYNQCAFLLEDFVADHNAQNIFDKLSETQNQNFSRLFNYDNWESKHIHSSHSQTQPSHVKPSCSWVTADSPTSPWVPTSSGGRTTPAVAPNCLYVYFPYLNFDTYQSIVRRRNLIKRRLNHGRSTPVPQEVADLESLEMRVVWEYIGYDPPLNCRRTLDQFGYPALQDTSARDDDQMLYKLTKQPPRPPHFHPPTGRPARTAPSSLRSMQSRGSKDDRETESSDDTSYEEEADLRDGNVLTVDQLWLWAIDTSEFC